MDQWNLFKSSSPDNSLMDFSSQGFGSNSRGYSSMNGHSGNSRLGIGSGGLNPYVSPLTSPTSPLANSSMGMGNGLGQQNMNSFGSNSSFNSGMTGGINSSYGGNGSCHSSGPPSSYGLNTSVPPPSGQHQSVNGYNNHQQQQQQPRCRYNYFNQSGVSQSSQMGVPRTPTSNFPPPPSASNMSGVSTPYYNANGTSSLYGNGSSNSNGMFSSMPSNRSMGPSMPPVHQNSSSSSNYYGDSNNSSSSVGGSFPPITEFKIDTFSISASGQVNESGSSADNSRNFSSSAHGSTNGSTTGDSNQNVRETGIIEKLLVRKLGKMKVAKLWNLF